MFMEFTTRRLIIKKFIPEYISLMYETWGNDLDVLMYIPEMKDIHSIDDFTDYIMRAYKDEYLIRSVIQEKDTNKIIGYVFLYQEDSRSKSVNIFIEKSHWGKGYGTEVLKSVIREMKKSHLECLYATCDGRNIGAKLMFEKAGFELIDTIKDYRKDIEGNIGDELLYELELD